MLRCEKGQLKGQAVKGMAGKPGVAEMVFGSVDAAGYNNSNLTPLSTTVVQR